MLERFIAAIHTEDPGTEEPAATRARLKDRFPPGAARRMTQLGMLVGAVLEALEPKPEDTIVYASRFGESRALEAFLDSFPSASPTLFQTSIHPSGVQQDLIGRQRVTPELFPLAGSAAQLGQALLAALLSPAERVIFCGGEERGTWLVEPSAASDRGFVFGLALTRARGADALGRIALEPVDESGVSEPGLDGWFDLLHARRAYAGGVAPGWRLTLEWS